MLDLGSTLLHYDLILTNYIYLQIKLHSKVLRVRASVYLFSVSSSTHDSERIKDAGKRECRA